MTSEADGAFVWIWLPGSATPVVAGRLVVEGLRVSFQYGRSYLARPDRIAIYEPELPLGDDLIGPTAGDHPLCIADAGPDSWGQRVILNARYGGRAADEANLGLVDFLLASTSNRIGALDFQASATEYMPRGTGGGTVAELASASELVDQRLPLTPELAEALLRGSSIGGARPKATLSDDRGRQLIAKFASSTDPFPVVQAEFVAMRLASRAGLDVAPVETAEALGHRVLLVERFDRGRDGTRRALVSALTILGLAEHEARYASYADLADVVRARFTDPTATLRELFGRIVFSILISNSDDHARNTAAFWDGRALTLTPAYDLCPQRRAGGESKQVMAIGRDGWRFSQLAGCVEHAAVYHLTPPQAHEIIDRQIEAITDGWSDVCDEARLTRLERDALWGAQFCNPYAFYDYRDGPPVPSPG